MRITLLSVLLLCAIAASAQEMEYKGFPSLVWPKLYGISFVKATDNLGEFDKPVFTEDVKALANKTIILPGYMVPPDNGLKSSRVMFSSLPLNACFFCGVGGPETVAELRLRKETMYTDKPVQVRGILRLNDTNPDEMIYVLEDAEVIGPVGF